MQRQTISFLTKRFKEVGIEPDKRKGQNFLIDLNLLELLAETAEAGSDDVILEVGTGTGSLTSYLASRAAEVITVEIDSHLYQLASEELFDFTNVTMLHMDALRNKNHFRDEVLDVVREKLQAAPGRQFKLAANLPYNVATPIISNLLRTDITPVRMAVTIQKELADRITAQPRTKDYSALSIWVQSQCDAETVRVMSPKVFWPRPKVDSAILRIDLNPEKRARIPDREFFHSFVRALFFHRRKFLRSVVASAYKGQLGKPDVDEILTEMELPANSRAEELDVATILRLCETVRMRLDSE